MGRPKGSVNKTEDATPQENAGVNEPVVTITASELQKMIADGVNTAITKMSTPEHIDDTGYWQAKCKCYSPIFGCIDAEQVIWLSEENEKTLKLGKFAETRVDQKTNMKVPVTFAHLAKPDHFTLTKIKQVGDVRAAEEGLLIHPPLFQNQSLDDRKPFRLVSAAA